MAEKKEETKIKKAGYIVGAKAIITRDGIKVSGDSIGPGDVPKGQATIETLLAAKRIKKA